VSASFFFIGWMRKPKKRPGSKRGSHSDIKSGWVLKEGPVKRAEIEHGAVPLVASDENCGSHWEMRLEVNDSLQGRFDAIAHVLQDNAEVAGDLVGDRLDVGDLPRWLVVLGPFGTVHE